MNCRPAPRHALNTVTIRSRFWPEHQTSGIPDVCRKMLSRQKRHQVVFGVERSCPPDRCRFLP